MIPEANEGVPGEGGKGPKAKRTGALSACRPLRVRA